MSSIPASRQSRYLSQRMAVRAAIGICAVLLVALAVIYADLLRSGSVHIEQSDLLVYYSASHLVVNGHGGQMYDFSVLKHAQHALYPRLLLPESEASFLYPPYYALALTPFALLTFSGAYAAWFLMNCVLAIVVLRSLQRYTRLGTSGSILFWLAALASMPVFSALVQGQSSILLTALLCGCFLALRSGRDAMAGTLLALALIKPYYAVPLLLMLLVRRRFMPVAVFAGVAALLVLLPTPVLGFSINRSYLQLLLRAAKWHDRLGGFAPYANHNFAGFSQLLVSGGAALAARVVLTLGALAFVVWCARVLDLDRSFAVAVLAGILVAPHVNLHDLSLLAVPTAVALRYRSDAPRSLGILLTVGYLAIIVGLRLVSVVPIQLSVLGMVALAVWLYRSQSMAEARHAPVRPSVAGAGLSVSGGLQRR